MPPNLRIQAICGSIGKSKATQTEPNAKPERKWNGRASKILDLAVIPLIPLKFGKKSAENAIQSGLLNQTLGKACAVSSETIQLRPYGQDV